MPSRSAAPPSPSSRQKVCSSVDTMWSRSSCVSVFEPSESSESGAEDGRAGETRTEAERRARARNDRPFHHAFELANVARPFVRFEVVHGAPRNLELRPSDPATVFLDEEANQQRDVLAPLPQGRHRDREDVQAIAEVRAESALPRPPRRGRRLVAAISRTSTFERLRCRPRARTRRPGARAGASPGARRAARRSRRGRACRRRPSRRGPARRARRR